MSSYEEKSGGGVSAVYNGKTVKCVGYRNLTAKPEDIADAYLVYDNEIIGAFRLKDKVRNEACEVLSGLKSSGFKNLVMLTGDGKLTPKRLKMTYPP